DAMQRAREGGRAVAGTPADSVATDETYWSHIQRAFDADRTLVNLNNGGCSPAPSHVLEAMIRDLRFSNEMPVHHMWNVLEPRIESVRRDLAADFGCDLEEMAITRNASEGLETLILGIEVFVDGAHAFAHFPFKRDDLECDYYGTSLHKWLFAPIGTGFLYVRKEKQKKIWPLMAAPASMDGDIRKYEEIGTHPAANHNAIAGALAFHQGIGSQRKAARLRLLRDRWAKRLMAAADPRVKVLTPLNDTDSCGIGLIHVEGTDTAKLQAHLWEK